MLVHHSSTPYAEAASAAAANMRTKMEGLIDAGRNRAMAVIDQVERQLPEDAIVRAPALRVVAPGGESTRLRIIVPGHGERVIHDHALSQVSQRTGMPWRYVQELRGTAWGRELIATNFNELLAHQDRTRYMIRTVTANDGNREVRGIMSDRYRRLDSRPIIEAFGKAAAAVGAVPVEGYALETRVAIKALLPRVFEPVPNEIMAFGVMLSNSDFGDGALSLRVFLLRLWCTNYAITDEALRQVHLGGALPEDISFSDRTYRLDTERSASMIRDIVGAELSAERVNAACDIIRRANDESITPSGVSAFLKRHMGITDAEAVTNAFTSADVVNMPAGQTAWRLSNAISWIAGRTDDEAKRLDLMKVAGYALPGGGVLHPN